MTLAAIACAAPTPRTDTKADVAAINAIREREIAQVAKGNADSLLTVFTNDVDFMPPNEPALKGQEAVKKWGVATFGQVSLRGGYTSSEVSVSGDWAVDHYTGTLTATPKAGGSPMEEHVKGIHIMKRQPDGTWKIALDVWNVDAAPPPTPPTPAKK